MKDFLIQILLLLLTFEFCYVDSDQLLDIEDFSYLKLPERCNGDFNGGLILVHSAPKNFDKRGLIRQTWGGVKGYKTVFLLGQVSESETDDMHQKLQQEFDEKQDIVQGSFIDSYRNMTYKHVMAYKYAVDYCPGAKFVLKTDDDIAVDTLHMPRYLKEYVKEFENDEPFILGDVVDLRQVIRDPNSDNKKWFVSKEEYPHDTYPLFCSGWAYTTNVPAIKLTLEKIKENKNSKHFWIDDVYITGMMRHEDITVYNWQKATLRSHVQHYDEVFKTAFFSPELMGSSNLKEWQIKVLFSKFEESHEKDWPGVIYRDENERELFSPEVIKSTFTVGKEEL